MVLQEVDREIGEQRQALDVLEVLKELVLALDVVRQWVVVQPVLLSLSLDWVAALHSVSRRKREYIVVQIMQKKEGKTQKLREHQKW